jgi:hypothetical protein
VFAPSQGKQDVYQSGFSRERKSMGSIFVYEYSMCGEVDEGLAYTIVDRKKV